MSKCCPIFCFTSSPLVITPLIPWSTSSASFLFPSPDLAHRPALCWLLSILLFSLTIPSLLFPPLLSFFPSFFYFLYSTISLFNFYSKSFFICFASCLSFVFSELSGLSQSLFSVPVASFPSSQTLSQFSLSSHFHHLSHLLIHFLLPLSSFCLLFSTILLYCSSFSHTFN